MSRKWRNILIGVLVVAAIVAAFLLLPKGPENYQEKYQGTYAAYLKAQSGSPRATSFVAVDVSSFSFNEAKERELEEETRKKAAQEAEEKAKAEAAEEAKLDAESESSQGIDETPDAPADGGEPDGTDNGQTAEEGNPPAGDEADSQASAGTGETEPGETAEETAGAETAEGEPAEASSENSAEAIKDEGIPNKLEMTWAVNVPRAGLYSIRVEYMLDGPEFVEREVLINSVRPFDEAGEVEFFKEGEKTTERDGVLSTYIRDDLGDYPSPYVFWFNEGKNTLTLSATDGRAHV